MKLGASYQVQWWQTVFVSEIANFLQLQNVSGHCERQNKDKQTVQQIRTMKQHVENLKNKELIY
jgi:hypothetical protein